MTRLRIRLLTLLCAVLVLFSFTGCKSSNSKDNSDNSSKTSSTTSRNTDATTTNGTTEDNETTTGGDFMETTTANNTGTPASNGKSTTTTRPGESEDNTAVKYTVTSSPLVFVTTSAQNAFKRANNSQIRVYSREKLDNSTGTVIEIVPSIVNQRIQGFGASITEAAAYSLYQIPEPERTKVMERLFHPDKGIGLSFIRNTIGSSDFALTGNPGERNAAGLPIGPYTYDDVPQGEEDWNLEHFSIERDLTMVVPLTKQALNINPQLRIMASPWTAPPWMKTQYTHYGYVTVNGQQLNATLRPECYEVYAQYFVKYLKAMEENGVPIHSITIQNEPGQSIHYPSMKMTVDEQVVFARDYLVPALRKNNLKTKVYCFDDNWHAYANAMTILFKAADSFDGVAFHSYSSNGTVQKNIYSAFPEKEIVVTEGSGLGNSFLNSIFTHASKIISCLRNQGSGYILWNLALSNKNGPLTYQASSKCDPLIMVDYVNPDNTEEYKGYKYTSEYYVLAHFSKFIRPGARQVFSTEADTVKNVSCLNEDGTLATVVTNTSIKPQTIKLVFGDKVVEYTAPASSIVTFVWNTSK
jgi:glucosylceramidase